MPRIEEGLFATTQFSIDPTPGSLASLVQYWKKPPPTDNNPATKIYWTETVYPDMELQQAPTSPVRHNHRRKPASVEIQPLIPYPCGCAIQYANDGKSWTIIIDCGGGEDCKFTNP